MRFLLALVVGLGLAACTDGGSSSSSSSSGGNGSGCTGHKDCPGGFACRLRECLTTCTSNTAYTGGCVMNATCDNGQCALPTTCSTTSDCAYDKGEVCQFSTGQCVASPESCDQGESETVCQNGYLCHIKVCYVDCDGTVGCPSGKSCSGHTCQ